ncbi:MAG: DUF6967 family protein [Alphaproteobacteria bacterium]
MTGEQDPAGGTVTRLERFQAPWGREITLDNVDHESGMRMLRITVREGRRFTIFDLDAPSAAHWGAALTSWARQEESGGS